jgi:hypothetical protein
VSLLIFEVFSLSLSPVIQGERENSDVGQIRSALAE